MSRYKKILKEKLKDFPYSLGAASLAVIFGIGNGFIKTTKVILPGSLIGIGGAYDLAISSGNFSDYYDEFKEFLKDLTENNMRVILHRLQKKGLVEKKNNKFRLTSLGLKYFKKFKNLEKKKWDGKWRIIFFDIPEKLRKERNWLRFQLCGLEYRQLQKSVFLGKFPLPENFFQEIMTRKLNNFIRLITIGEIDDEKILEAF